MATKVHAFAYTCQFSCISRLAFQGLMCSTNAQQTEEERRSLQEYDSSSISGNVTFPGSISQNPVFYSISNLSETVEVPTADACSQACRNRCGDVCGQGTRRFFTGSQLSGDQRACLDVDTIPSFVVSPDTICRRIVRGGPLPSVQRWAQAGQTASRPDCTAPAAAPTVSPVRACNPPPVPANDSAKKCVFFCMQPGVGSDGNGRAALETGQNSQNQSCVNVNVVRRVGQQPCTQAGNCACEEECKRTCGSEGGKTRCFLGRNNPDQILACSGAGNIGQAQAPQCLDDPNATGTSRTLFNPLSTTDIGEVIARFIRAVTGIAGSMALLMFVVGGVIWMTAESSDRVKLAQTILKNASLGLILIFFAYSIVSLFLSVLGV